MEKKNQPKPFGGGVRRLGFTLAEVLITLAVIGIVAALTIPIVIHKYQQKQLYTAFIKTYNVLTNAIELSIIDNGFPTSWDYSDGGSHVLETYIGPYLKVAKFCENDVSNCYVSTYSYLDGEEDEDPEFLPMYVLTDGSIIADFSINEYDGLLFFVDTNGKKGPNVLGRDVFYLDYDNEKQAVVGVEYHAAGSSDSSGSYYYDGNCDPNVKEKEQGLGCAERLLQEGKMNY